LRLAWLLLVLGRPFALTLAGMDPGVLAGMDPPHAI